MTLSLEEVREIPLGELGIEVDGAQDVSTVIALGVTGDACGNLLLAVDDEGAASLAGLLLNRAPRPCAEWGELERSALMETGNILGSAYLSALSECTGLALFPTPPEMLRDYLPCVLQQAAMTQAMESDVIPLARTGFRFLGNHVAWNLVFVPSPELLRSLRASAMSPTASTDSITVGQR